MSNEPPSPIKISRLTHRFTAILVLAGVGTCAAVAAGALLGRLHSPSPWVAVGPGLLLAARVLGGPAFRSILGMVLAIVGALGLMAVLGEYAIDGSASAGLLELGGAAGGTFAAGCSLGLTARRFEVG